MVKTLESRRIVNALLNWNYEGWNNRDRGVWIVGKWCRDVIVLLEVYVRSAVRVVEEGFGGRQIWKMIGLEDTIPFALVLLARSYSLHPLIGCWNRV